MSKRWCGIGTLGARSHYYMDIINQGEYWHWIVWHSSYRDRDIDKDEKCYKIGKIFIALMIINFSPPYLYLIYIYLCKNLTRLT